MNSSRNGLSSSCCITGTGSSGISSTGSGVLFGVAMARPPVVIGVRRHRKVARWGASPRDVRRIGGLYGARRASSLDAHQEFPVPRELDAITLIAAGVGG